MKLRVARTLGVALLYLLVHLCLTGCFGSQQEEQGLEVSQQSSESSESSDEGASQDSGSEEGAESYQQSSDEDLSEDSYENSESGSDDTASDYAEDSAESETESDLQEIIQEMNSQQEIASEGSELPPEQMVEQVAQNTASTSDLAPMQESSAVPTDASAAPMEASASDLAPAPAAGSVPFQPGGTPAAQGLPEMGSKMPYIVQAGDTLAKIATRIYGDQERWREMSNLTGLANPNHIYPGDVVYYSLDEQSLAFATAYENVTRGQETVQAGDTLERIASRVYGTPNAWKSVWRQNDTIDNPDKLEVGMTVYYVQHNTLAQAIQDAKAAVAELIAADQNIKVAKDHSVENAVGFSG